MTEEYKELDDIDEDEDKMKPFKDDWNEETKNGS